MSIRARKILKGRGKEIFKTLRDKVYATFPKETVAFFKREVDRFENPLAHRLEEGLKGLVSLLGEEEFSWEKADYYLDRLIKIEAIQGRKPSEGLAFLFFLKSAVREVAGEEILGRFGPEGLLEVEDYIDALTLRAFNHYLAAREKLNEIKFQEWKGRLFLLLKRAGYIYDEREGSLAAQAPLEEKENPH
ncbi:MAG: hypothetical protein DSZ24_07565 [Thermodesulfatator sp.]|nr:MAG: hypothetical protein DSZ24_07565 [Thermodesulfatator sp.]